MYILCYNFWNRPSRMNSKRGTLKRAASVFLPLFLFIVVYANAQVWQSQSRMISSSHLTNIYFADSLTGWMTGNGGLWRTLDGGHTWETQETGVSTRLRSLYFIDAQTGWIAGSFGTILKTEDGGASWEVKDPDDNKIYYNIFFIDHSAGWVAGRDGTILKTTDGGDHWIRLDTGTEEWLINVYFLDRDRGWAVGREGTVLRTTDGGDTWTSQAPGADDWLYRILFTDSENGLIVGYGGAMLKTSDGGESWTPLDPGVTDTLSNVFFVNADVGWTVGFSGSILRTMDGGATWTPQFSGTNEHLFGVHFFNEQEGWVVGDYGIMLRTRDGGETWRYDGFGKDLNDVFFIDSLQGWTVGEDGYILRTTDGGGSWQGQNSGTSQDLNSVWFNGSEGWIAGAGGTVLTTQNGGNVWESIRLPTDADMQSVYFINRDTGWIGGGESNLWKTTDGGKQWVDIGPSGTNNILSVHFFDVLNGYGLAESGALMKTEDGGEIWRFIVKVVPDNTGGKTFQFNKLFFPRTNVGYRVGTEGEIERTMDRGENWTSLSSGIELNLQDVYFLNPSVGWVVGANGTIMRTINGGNTWEIQHSNLDYTLNNVHFSASGRGWAVGENAVILHHYSEDLEDENLCSRQDSFTLVTLYNEITQGKNWRATWDFDAPMDSWFGATVSEKGCVTGLNLASNNLNGKMVSTLALLGELSQLTSLNLADNVLFGAIPEEIYNYRKLQLLDLSNNDMEGLIPPEIQRLSTLRRLDLRNNQLNGATPPEVNALKSLQYLDLSGNKLTDLPILQLDSLSVLLIKENKLTFEDILPNLTYLPEDSAYAPQKPLDELTYAFEPCDSSFAIGSRVDETLGDKIFSWYKEDELLVVSEDNYLQLEDFFGLDYAAYEGLYRFTLDHPQIDLQLAGSIQADLADCVNVTTPIRETLCIDADTLINGKVYNFNNPKDCILDRSASDPCVTNRILVDLSFGEPDTVYITDTILWRETVRVCNQAVDCSEYNQVLECYNPESGCIAPFKIQLHCREQPEEPLAIPNAFTPNGDGENDFFVIPLLIEAPEKYQKNRLQIFNRYKQLVYEAAPYRQEPANLWDGTDQSGRPLPAGAYFYVFSYAEGSPMMGIVSIIR